MSLRDERKQQTRQALLDAALGLSTAGRSFSIISLREVAREAGLVPTAFYRHFVDYVLGQVNPMWTWQRVMARVEAIEPIADDMIKLTLSANKHF
ncbi:MAG: hypothetical protein ACEQSD_10050, partial [Flavobacteriales bacterium]